MSSNKPQKVKVVGGCGKHVIVERPHASGQGVERMTMEQCEDGKPIPVDDGVFQIMKAEDGTHEMHTLIEPRKGPSRVATRAYRSGYDAVFGASHKSKELN